MKSLFWLGVAGGILFAWFLYFRASEADKIADKGNAELEKLYVMLREGDPANLHAEETRRDRIRYRQESRDSWRKTAEGHRRQGHIAAAIVVAAALAGITWEVLRRKRRRIGNPPADDIVAKKGI